MRIVLWAYHDAGYRTLRKLYAQGHEVLVFTENNPPYIPSVTELANSLNLEVYVGINDDCMREKVDSFQPELGLSMYYPRIIREAVLSIPGTGSFNFHPSLLPRHRGCFSAPWAILEGDEVTGVTCHEMLARVDSGRILCQSRVLITKDDTAFSLYNKLVDSAVMLLDEALIKLAQLPVALAEQGAGGCFHYREIPYQGRIGSGWPMDKVERFIRAMYFPPHPPAELVVKDKIYQIHTMDDYRRLLEIRS